MDLCDLIVERSTERSCTQSLAWSPRLSSVGHMYNQRFILGTQRAKDLIKKRQLGRAVRSKEARAKIANEMQEQAAEEKRKRIM